MGKAKSEPGLPRRTGLRSSSKSNSTSPRTRPPLVQEETTEKHGCKETVRPKRGRPGSKSDIPSKIKTRGSGLKVSEARSSSGHVTKKSDNRVTMTTTIPAVKSRVSTATKSKAKSPAESSTTSGQTKRTPVSKSTKKTPAGGKRRASVNSSSVRPKKSKTTLSKPKQKRKTCWVSFRANFELIYQLKVELQESRPLIWRRIQVPTTFNFHKLHLTIQEAMGWRDGHLHQFELDDDTQIGIPCPEFPEINPLDEKKELIADRFDLSHKLKKRILYNYDFGDNWDHMVTLEKTLQAVPGEFYPKCIAGERACPPENVGGMDGYYSFLRTLKNPNDEEYEEMKEWADDYGWEGDPAHFDPSECYFYRIL